MSELSKTLKTTLNRQQTQIQYINFRLFRYLQAKWLQGVIT